jgi:pyruvate,water dikinase
VKVPWELRDLGAGLDEDRFGVKAARLGAALARGLPVPPGVVLSREAHHVSRRPDGAWAMPRRLTRALTARLADLGPGPWVVRTSAPDEDTAGLSSAGLYHSELDVPPDGVGEAVLRCYAAAEHESLGAYRRALGRDPALVSVAVLIQRQVRARWAGVLFTHDRPPGSPSPWRVVELREEDTTAVTGGTAAALPLGWRPGDPPPLPPETPLPGLGARLEWLASRCEQELGSPADVEWAAPRPGAVALLQLRPITAPALGGPPPRCWIRDTLWRWDGEHNPDPLSPLHASLVVHLDRTLRLPFRLRVEDGYLYTALTGADAAQPPPADADAAGDSWWPTRGEPLLREALQILERLIPRPENLCRVSPAPRGPRRNPGTRFRDEGLVTTHASWPAVLAAFSGFYGRYAAEVGPHLAAAERRQRQRLRGPTPGDDADAGLEPALAGVPQPLVVAVRDLAVRATAEADLRPWLSQGRLPPIDTPGGAAFRQAARRWLDEIGALAAAWDVASPTLRERPGLLYRAVARSAFDPSESVESRHRDGHVAVANRSPPPASRALRATLEAKERDDLYFARALAALRGWLLAAAEPLVAAGRLDRPESIFALSLENLPPVLRGDPEAENLELPPWPPEAPHPPQDAAPSAELAPAQRLRGVGCGEGRVRGRVRLLGPLSDAFDHPFDPQPDEIVVCAALLPSAVPLLVGSRGVVTDQGGRLSHGAILARELGIPAVLGTAVATRALRTGDRVLLDAKQGWVIRLAEGTPT